MECDTEMSSSAECARRVIDGLNSGVRLSVFSKVRSSTENEIRLGGDKVEVVSRVGRDPQYEVFADEFLDHASDGLFNAHYDRPACLDLLGDVRGLRVLDAACGPGLYAEELAKRGAIVTGFDQSPRMVELARQRVPAGEFRVHDLADPLDWLENESFDLVLLALAIEYVDDRVGRLRNSGESCHLRVLSSSQGIIRRPIGSAMAEVTLMFESLKRPGARAGISDIGSLRWNKRVRRFMRPASSSTELLSRNHRPEAESIDAAQFARLQSAPGFIAFRVVPAMV
jgi:SAM-dependent methyltransferase